MKVKKKRVYARLFGLERGGGPSGMPGCVGNSGQETLVGEMWNGWPVK